MRLRVTAPFAAEAKRRQSRRRAPSWKFASVKNGEKSVYLPAVIDVAHDDAARLLETEKHPPLPDTQSVATLQRALQSLDVAPAGLRERL
jgi:hypothetical protein